MYADFEDLREGLAEPEFEVFGNVVNLSQRPVRVKSAVQTHQYIVPDLVRFHRMDIDEFRCSAGDL